MGKKTQRRWYPFRRYTQNTDIIRRQKNLAKEFQESELTHEELINRTRQVLEEIKKEIPEASAIVVHGSRLDDNATPRGKRLGAENDIEDSDIDAVLILKTNPYKQEFGEAADAGDRMKTFYKWQKHSIKQRKRAQEIADSVLAEGDRPQVKMSFDSHCSTADSLQAAIKANVPFDRLPDSWLFFPDDFYFVGSLPDLDEKEINQKLKDLLTSEEMERRKNEMLKKIRRELVEAVSSE